MVQRSQSNTKRQYNKGVSTLAIKHIVSKLSNTVDNSVLVPNEKRCGYVDVNVRGPQTNCCVQTR